MKFSPAASVIIRSFEGILDGDPSTVNFDPYMDPSKIWTIGWGHAIWYRGRFLTGEVDRALARSLYPNGLALAECVKLLDADMAKVEVFLNKEFTRLTQSQFDALGSFAFNCGVDALDGSTLARKLRQGDAAGAAAEFPRWNKSKGVVLAGLTRRREAERLLFLTPPAIAGKTPTMEKK